MLSLVSYHWSPIAFDVGIASCLNVFICAWFNTLPKPTSPFTNPSAALPTVTSTHSPAVISSAPTI